MRRQELHPYTRALNKIQKNQSKLARNKALSWLISTFPQAFDNSISIRPLKIGIIQDILDYAQQAALLGISKSKLREAVVLFTRRIDYLACLKAREMRIDLAGNPIDLVTEEEALRAASKIKKYVEKSIRAANTSKISTPVAATKSYSTSPAPIASYPERSLAFSATQPPQPTTIVIKPKTKQYDPSVVARLKEKLGLASKIEANE